MFQRTYIDVYERLRQSEQSRRLAWHVLQEIRLVLQILGDQRIPYEGELKRFRVEGDFLVRALTDLITLCRSQIHQLEREFEDLEKLLGEPELPRDVLQAVWHPLWPAGKNGSALRRAIARAAHQIARAPNFAGRQSSPRA